MEKKEIKLLKVQLNNLVYDIKWFVRRTFNIGKKIAVECPNCYTWDNLLRKDYGYWIGKCKKCGHELSGVKDIYNHKLRVSDLTLSKLNNKKNE